MILTQICICMTKCRAGFATAIGSSTTLSDQEKITERTPLVGRPETLIFHLALVSEKTFTFRVPWNALPTLATLVRVTSEQQFL